MQLIKDSSMIGLRNTRTLAKNLPGMAVCSRIETVDIQQTRKMGRRMPKQGKPPILPPSKKVLYHVVHAPWEKPEDVEENLWRRHVYNNAVISLREVFKQELKNNASIGRGIDSMKEAEAKELDELLAENDKRNKEKAAARAAREADNTKEAKKTILSEIEDALKKKREEKKIAEAEVKAAIERSSHFVSRENLESKILEALEKPVIYDFAIDRMGNKYYDPEPVKYQEGTPTRQKKRLYDQTLGTNLTSITEENPVAVAENGSEREK